MSVIIRLQNLPLTANSIDIRNFFRGLSIPDGGVHIVGGSEGDAFIAFSTDEDARQAMQLTGQKLKDSPVKLLLSSRNEMFKVIEQARLQALGLHPQGSPSSLQGGENSTSSQSSSASSNALQTNNTGGGGGMPPLRSPDPTNSNQTNPMIINSGNNNALPIPTGQPVGNMQNFPTPNMNLPTGNVPNHFMPQGIMANFPGIPTGPPPQQQHQQFPNIPPNPQGMFNNRVPNPSVNPFIIPPNMPSMGNPMGFPGMMPNSMTSGSSNSPGNIGGAMGNLGNQAGMNSNNGILGMPGMMNQQGPTPGGIPGAFNVGGPRMGGMNNPMGMNNNNGMNGPGGAGNNFMGMGPNNNFPPFMGGSGGNNNKAGAPSGGMGPGPGPGSRPPRPNFNPHNQQHQHRPTGPMNNNNMSSNNGPRERNLGLNAVSGGIAGHNNRENEIGNPNQQHRENRDSRDTKGGRRSRSRSRERRERENTAARRRRSRSRSRDRDADVRGDRNRDRRRRRSRSKSRSRSRDRVARAGRRNSRDREKGSRDERRKSESSPEKNTDKSGSAKRGQDIEKRGRRDSDPVSNINNITDEEHPCIKLIGLPKDASFREIREFVRVDIQGGGEGVVRHFDEGLAFLKLERASDFPKVYRSNGRKLRNSIINVEGISFDKWTLEYKNSKKEGSRDRERDVDRDRDRERDFRDRDRHNDREKNSNQRTSRFNNNNANSVQSSCIAIRGLPPAITGKDVSSRLLRDAPVNDLLVVPAQGTNGRPSVTAFVNLENPTAAQRAVDSIVRSQEGASLIVELCELEDMNQARRTAPGGQSRDRDNRQGGSGAKSLFDLDVGMDIESSSVMLQGVPPNITDRDVFDFFSDIGLKPTNVRKLFDAIGSPNGQVVCEFQDNHKALRATTKDGMMFGRNSISVTLIPSNGASVNNLDFRNPHGGMSRPSLLGVRPNGPGNASQNPRFHNPNPNPNPNPFVQAMQQSMVPNLNPGPGPGMRPSGPTRGMRNPGTRMSRFDARANNNMDYDDFRDSGNGNRNGVDRDDRVSSATRGRGHNSMSSNDLGLTPEKIHLFKPGCIVALTNVPFKAEIEDIAKFLEDVLKIQIPYDRIVRNLNDMGKSTGNARVAFQTSCEAELANDRLRGSTMWNRPIITEVLSEIVWS